MEMNRVLSFTPEEQEVLRRSLIENYKSDRFLGDKERLLKLIKNLNGPFEEADYKIIDECTMRSRYSMDCYCTKLRRLRYKVKE